MCKYRKRRNDRSYPEGIKSVPKNNRISQKTLTDNNLHCLRKASKKVKPLNPYFLQDNTHWQPDGAKARFFRLQKHVISVNFGKIKKNNQTSSTVMKHAFLPLLLIMLTIAPILPAKAQNVTVSIKLSPEQMKSWAESGNAQAQYQLGGSYYYGENGFKQDYKKAFYWYNEAAKQSYSDAYCELGNCYSNGEGVTQDLTEAAYWYRKGAEAGDGNAQNNLGNCYLTGEGITKNVEKAFYWYGKSAGQNNPVGLCNLGYCYYKGRGVTQNYSQAVKYFRKSAQQGTALAQYYMGECYYYGRGTTQDYAEAVAWYRKAAEQDNAEALFSLGYCYEHGQGVEEDQDESIKWYQKAANLGHKKAKEEVDSYYMIMQMLYEE